MASKKVIRKKAIYKNTSLKGMLMVRYASLLTNRIPLRKNPKRDKL